VEGNVYGMYFGGHGNFISTVDTVGWILTKHLAANAGYQLGSGLVVTNNSSSDRSSFDSEGCGGGVRVVILMPARGVYDAL